MASKLDHVSGDCDKQDAGSAGANPTQDERIDRLFTMMTTLAQKVATMNPGTNDPALKSDGDSNATP